VLRFLNLQFAATAPFSRRGFAAKFVREKGFGAVLGKIFISHSSANNAEALAINDWLSEQGWGDVFLDLDPKRGLVAGDRWQAALKYAS
jgi:hypothetical protein